MLNIIPIMNVLINLVFIGIFQYVLSCFIPTQWLPFNGTIRTLILYLVTLFGMYTQFGQMCVAFCARGRNTIGREEKVLQPIIELLKDRTDIRGYSAPVLMQLRILEALNNLTGKTIKPLDRKVNRIKYEYLTGTVKIFTFDSYDIETNSYGNSIFVSKGAIDTLPQEELKSVIYNEFAQVKTNIANMRLLHDGNIVLGRLSAIATIILSPFALGAGILGTTVTSMNSTFGTVNTIGSMFSQMGAMLFYVFICVIRIILWRLTKKFTNVPYMLYERKIFIKADRATHKQGFSAGMLSYLEKLYAFKLGDKETSQLFVELRPLVAYRINYFDNVLGRNRELSADNYAWSSNYMERVQTINNNKK
ncbi:hypothetical protein FDB24_16740 [Clostridium botulinum]|nr:hypothetical protein [Clostridium botulinum]NFO22860.1 hypothetical protein [Clostridium botulinum]HBJ2623683.1 hypothetical protein [Clostridium botulinum]